MLIFTTFLYPQVGGISSSINAQTNWLTRNGCTVDVLSLGLLPKFSRYVLLNGPAFAADRIVKGTGFLWTYIIRRMIFGLWILTYFQSKKWQVIVTHDICAFDCLWSIRSRTIASPRKYLIVNDYYAISHVAHGSIRSQSAAENYAKLREVRAYRAATKVVAVDSRIKRYVTRVSGVPEDRVLLILNWVNTEFFRPAESSEGSRASLGIPVNRFIILVPRRLVTKTGVEYSVRAMKKLKDILGTRVLMIIAGTGDEENRLRILAKQLSLDDIILFLGDVHHDRMPAIYRASDCVVIPSVNVYGLEEASSLAALEAMSSALPVVASSIGGLSEMIKDDSNGVLVRERDSEALASALLRLYNDPTLRARISLAAREYVVVNSIERKRAFLSLVTGVSESVSE